MDTTTPQGRALNVPDDRKALAEALQAGEGDVLVRKFVTKAAEVADPDARIIRQIISTETADREGDVVRAKGGQLDAWRENPVVLWAHNYNEPPIARGIDVYARGKEVVSLAEYPEADVNPFADQIYRMKLGGFLKAASIGFVPIEHKSMDPDAEGFEAMFGPQEFTKWELLEWSDVPVPANPEALMAAAAKGVADPNLLAKMGFDVPREVIDLSGRSKVAKAPVDEPGIELVKQFIETEVTRQLDARALPKLPAPPETVDEDPLAARIARIGR